MKEGGGDGEAPGLLFLSKTEKNTTRRARAGQGVTRETEKQTDEYKSANVKSIFSLRVFE